MAKKVKMEDSKKCNICLEDKSLESFSKHSGTKDKKMTYCKICSVQKVKEWRHNNPEKSRNQSKKNGKISSTKYRTLVLSAYGEQCQCCGEDNREFLCIDHIEGGGTQHRKELGKGGRSFYIWLIKNDYPEGYRTLCHNCNASMGHYGYCPHEI